MAERPGRASGSSSAGAAADARELADRLHSLAIHLLRRLRAEDRASGLSAPRLSALSVVVFRGPIVLGELAAAEQVRPPTMTRLVQALERQGLVKRRHDPGDRRVVLVEVTPRGRALFARARARRVDRLAERLAALDGAALGSLGEGAKVLAEVVRGL
jgi:DNA-binding MarR family transcriptional regulator